MQDGPIYDDVVADIGAALHEAQDRGRAAGVEHLWLDPGIGFGKTTDHNLVLLRELQSLASVLDEPMLVGVSRKRFIGEIHAIRDQSDGEVGTKDRREGSMVCSVWAWLAGAHIVRVHDVRLAAMAAKHVRRLTATTGTVT